MSSDMSSPSLNRAEFWATGALNRTIRYKSHINRGVQAFESPKVRLSVDEMKGQLEPEKVP